MICFAPVLHSVSYAGFWGQASLTLDAFIDKASELGFEGVMLMAKRPHASVLDLNAAGRAALKHRLSDTAVGQHVILAGYNNFTADLEHGDVPHGEIQIDYITSLASLAHDLGASVLRVFTGYEHPAAPYSRQWDMVVACLRECACRAADYGVTLGVQNHHDLACGFEALHDLLSAVGEPNCRALFDAWAPALHGADLSEGARLLGPLTVHTTVANYVRRPRYLYRPELVNYTEETPFVQAVRMSAGFIDYPRFWSEMSDGGFTGTIAYEMCSPLLEGRSTAVLDAHAREFLAMARAFREARTPALSGAGQRA